MANDYVTPEEWNAWADDALKRAWKAAFERLEIATTKNPDGSETISLKDLAPSIKLVKRG